MFLFFFSLSVQADTPISLFESHAGNVNFVGTQKTRRTQPNSGNPCAVLNQNSTNTANISGIPNGSTIVAAHLYWTGTYSGANGSTNNSTDYNVTFEGINIVADRQYTSDYDATERYFSGAEDVTSIVQNRSNPNGSYSFSGLTVNTGRPHCTYATVIAGWGLAIIYEHPSEDFRVVNLYEGFELMYGGNVVLTPDNFRVPSTSVNGKHAYLTWDGDAENSGSRNGFNERLTFNGSVLSDANNPTNNQYNSVSNINGVDTNSYGVDFDFYSIDSLLSPGDTSATSVYSSGADQVHLSMEIISITNTPVSDLSVTKTATSAFNVGSNATYNISVSNQGPNDEPGNIVVTDNLPAGLTFISATGSGWSCGNSGQLVTCTRTGSLADGASTTPITVTVSIGPAAAPSVSNTANVSGQNFDNISSNDSSTISTVVSTGPAISLQKHLLTISDPVNGTNNPKAIPGAISQYTITATNAGQTAADNNTIVLSDSIPANTALYVNDITGANSGPIRFVDGSPSSGLNYVYSGLSSNTDNLSFSQNGGADSFNYTPVPNAQGVDTNVTDLRVTTSGQFLPTNASGDPSFQIMFRVRVE